MSKIKEFVLASYEEMKSNVTWPTYSELTNNTVIVLVASLIFALAIGGFDALVKLVTGALYGTV